MALAFRSESRLSCAAPEAAVVNPGSSNITHEPASSSETLRDRVGRSVVTLYSVPARTFLAPLAVNSLPLRLSMTGGPEGAAVPLIRPPPGAMANVTGAAAGAAACAPGAPRPPRPAAAPGAAPGAPPRPPRPPPPRPNPTAPPPPPTFMRPMSPLHTAAFQVGLTSQASSTSIPVMLTM
ncbi:hypothetical protein D3C83_11180 [compost metagenome]